MHIFGELVHILFRGVSAYFRSETSFQNLETSFEKSGAIMAARVFTMILTKEAKIPQPFLLGRPLEGQQLVPLLV